MATSELHFFLGLVRSCYRVARSGPVPCGRIKSLRLAWGIARIVGEAQAQEA